MPEDEDEIAVLLLAQVERPADTAPAHQDFPIRRCTQIQAVIENLRFTRAPLLPCYEAAPGVMLELVDEAPPALI
ncbi:MAG TPA: hypothetical protein VGM12_31710 [Trebonia sp.]